jgi:hypothetical protein
MKTRYKILIILVTISVGFIAITFGQQWMFEYQEATYYENQDAKKLELAQKGVVTYDSQGSGQNIVDYRLEPYNGTTKIDEELEKRIREKQDILSERLEESVVPALREITDKNAIPLNSVSISHEWNALEIGIKVEHMTEENIPKYFDVFRNVVGNEINLVLVPTADIRPHKTLEILINR